LSEFLKVTPLLRRVETRDAEGRLWLLLNCCATESLYEATNPQGRIWEPAPRCRHSQVSAAEASKFLIFDQTGCRLPSPLDQNVLCNPTPKCGLLSIKRFPPVNVSCLLESNVRIGESSHPRGGGFAHQCPNSASYVTTPSNRTSLEMSASHRLTGRQTGSTKTLPQLTEPEPELPLSTDEDNQSCGSSQEINVILPRNVTWRGSLVLNAWVPTVRTLGMRCAIWKPIRFHVSMSPVRSTYKRAHARSRAGRGRCDGLRDYFIQTSSRLFSDSRVSSSVGVL
jgi:hypothetical protein